MKQKLLLILWTSLSLINAMEIPIDTEIVPIEQIILNTLNKQIHFHSNHYILPKEISQKIGRYICFESSAENLNHTADIINRLAQTNKTLKKLFNDSQNCLCIIKKLSDRFDFSHEKVAETLSIKAASQRLYLQKTFLSYCRRFAHPYDDQDFTLRSRFKKLKRDNVDFNFTYGANCSTGLMLALSPSDPETNIAKYLILNGADLHLEDKNGFSAHSMVFKHHPYFIPFLQEYNKIESNKINGNSRTTPLINLMNGLIVYTHSQQNIKYIENGMKILFEAGTDPELEDNKNNSPLSLARKEANNYPQFVRLLQNAIEIKHALQ